MEEITAGKYVPPRRVVHLGKIFPSVEILSCRSFSDLKGAPPLLSYLQTLFPLLARSGATDLLVEYEDMFPFSGPLANVSARNAFTVQEIAELLQTARDNNLTVIPLVQTFGHMEWILKLEKFKHLREESSSPQSICPSREGSLKLVRLLLSQIMEVHKDSTHVHIGCDEVYQLGQCERCLEKVNRINGKSGQKHYYNYRSLFLDHVKTVASFVNSKGKSPVMWDDMLRNMPRPEVRQSGLGPLVEVMVWCYESNIDTFIDHTTWRLYAELFRGVWAAGAFKGATGERQYVPDIQHHVRNQLSWLLVMQRENDYSKISPVKFSGLVLTGWARYDHFAVLCELLPVAVPSLVINLVVVSLAGLTFPVSRRIHNLLGCDNIKMLISLEELRRNGQQWDMTRCDFPGVQVRINISVNQFELSSKVFSLISKFALHSSEVDTLHHTVRDKSAWMSAWNIKSYLSFPSIRL